MARSKRMAEEEQDLNLAPIMNMVVILIPLLLLSVVFLKVAVINITAPKLSMGPSTETPPEDEEKPLNLTVAIAPTGLRISAEGGNWPVVQGCPQDGPTICLKDGKQGSEISDQFRQGRQKVAAGDMKTGEELIESALKSYNWHLFYNELSRIKKKFPEETVMNVSADPDIPFAAVVRAMDVARYKLKKGSYDQPQAFWDAKYEMEKVTQDGKVKEKPANLFSDPVLALVK